MLASTNCSVDYCVKFVFLDSLLTVPLDAVLDTQRLFIGDRSNRERIERALYQRREVSVHTDASVGGRKTDRVPLLYSYVSI